MATYYNGTQGSVLGATGSADLNVKDWKCKVEVTSLDVTHQNSSGNYAGTTGMKKYSGSFTAVYDADIHGSTPTLIKPGQQATLKLERYDNDTNPLSGTANLLDCEFDHSYDSMFAITVSFEYTGAVTGFLAS